MKLNSEQEWKFISNHLTENQMDELFRINYNDKLSYSERQEQVKSLLRRWGFTKKAIIQKIKENATN